MKKIAIVGAGWAGLSAALQLQKAGHHVTIYDRAPAKGECYQGAGGRASTAYAAMEKTPFAVDNGQHVLLGAYTDTLAVLKSIGIDTERAFLRIPASWRVPQSLNIVLPKWGDSKHTQGLWASSPLNQLPLAIALFKAIPLINWGQLAAAALRLQVLKPYPAETVTQYLLRLKFPARFNDQLWQPLCYATLNTPPDRACATVFRRVIQDGLLSGSYAAAMLVPNVDLGALLPERALKTLVDQGAQLRLGVAAKRIKLCSLGVSVYSSKLATFKNEKAQIFGNAMDAADNTNATDCGSGKEGEYGERGGGSEASIYDALVCATTAKDAARILPSDCMSYALKSIAQQAPEPITTIHLNLAPHITLAHPVMILPEPIDLQHPIQHAVVIDRNYLNPLHKGWFSVVLSCSSLALRHSHETLIQTALARLHECFPQLQIPPTCKGVVIHAKQATFACEAALKRPAAQCSDKRIVLAGDYVEGPYPATLEGAVRSGLLAAQFITQQTR